MKKGLGPSWSREAVIQAIGFFASECPQHTKHLVLPRNRWEYPLLPTSHSFKGFLWLLIDLIFSRKPWFYSDRAHQDLKEGVTLAQEQCKGS